MNINISPNLPSPDENSTIGNTGAAPAKAVSGEDLSVSSRVSSAASSGIASQQSAQASDTVPLAVPLPGLGEMRDGVQTTQLPDIGTTWRCVALRRDVAGGTQLTFKAIIPSELSEYTKQMNKTFPALEAPIGMFRNLLQFTINQAGNSVRVFEVLGYACDSDGQVTLPDLQHLQNAWGEFVKGFEGSLLPASLPIADAEGILDDLSFFEEVKSGRIPLSPKECLHDHPYHVAGLIEGLIAGRSVARVTDDGQQISLWQERQTAFAGHLERYQQQVMGFTDALAAGNRPEDAEKQIQVCHAMLGMLADYYTAKPLVQMGAENWVDSMPVRADEAIRHIMQIQKRWRPYFADRFKVDESVVNETIEQLGNSITNRTA